ncbi:MAG: GNAT family N-acetyltransferase [Kiloniellales bacterium]
MVRITTEAPWHRGAREALLDEALGLERQLKSSEGLREGRLPVKSLVALDGETLVGSRLVGSLRLWRVREASGRLVLLLGPLAVAEGWRGRGIGARLMRAALNWAAAARYDAVVLVGDLAYYRRFGFENGLSARLAMAGHYDPARLLGLELQPGALAALRGTLVAAGEPDPAVALLSQSAASSHRRLARRRPIG